MLNAGDTSEATLTVEHRDTAQALALETIDEFPAVFATSRMIALMELAAARLMKPLLGPGQLSVGVAIDTQHLTATPIGARVRATATYVRSEGRLLHFTCEAFDEAGSIGSGTHTRAVIDTERLLSGAVRRRRV